ncbi:unnamed protein product [Ectocarpus sp. CCAP 1310/34]|nr:unnamed protein product [Ectocarpus sp. CCAP 1310/34]
MQHVPLWRSARQGHGLNERHGCFWPSTKKERGGCLYLYPAYIAFRTALRTGNFNLRCDALRRIAKVFYITGKDRYQFLVADHLAEMAILPESDRKVIAELFSVALGPDVFARIGLDERQEVANRFYKTMTKRIVSSFIEKLAPIAQLREEALIQFEREYIEQAQKARDRSREVALKREPAVKEAREVLLKSPAFQGDEGVGKIMSLDGRVVTQKEEEELVSAPTKAVEKFQEVVAHCVLRDPEKKGTTKKNVFSIPPKNTTNQSTKSQGRKSGLKDNIANAFAGGREFKALFLNTMDAADEHGSVTPELLAELVSQVGAPRPYSMLNSKGGEIQRSSVGHPYNEMSEAFGADGEADEGGWYGLGPEHLLHFRNGFTSGTVVQRDRGPDVGEAELSVAHFIVWAEKYWGKKLDKWLVTSVDTGLWMIILLAMSTGKIPPNVSIRWTLPCRGLLGELRSSYWSTEYFQGCIPTADENVRLFALIYLLAGCDFLPAMSGLPFYKMWILSLKSVRAEGVFNRSLFVMEDGVWTVDIEQSIKLLATIFYFRYEAAFAGVTTTPGDLLRSVNDSVRNYVDLIRVAIVKLGKKRTTDTCPTYRSMREQCLRMKFVDGYWQDGFKDHMPERDFNGKGWGINPKAKGSNASALTGENCVMWVSEHSSIGPDGKMVTMTCGCDPVKALDYSQ